MNEEFPERPELEIMDDARRRRFSKKTLNPQAWFESANQLSLAISLIAPSVEAYWELLRKHEGFSDELPEYECHFILMMLAGYAIENLCKGHLMNQLTQTELEGVNKGDFPKRFGKHDIAKLVAATGASLSAADEQLLTRIEECVGWRGRYPIPKSYKATKPTFQSGSDTHHIEELIDKLRRKVGARASYQTG